MLPQEVRNRAVQRELINGAMKTVAAMGLENTTTSAICKKSGINVAYIYHFFESKEDLIAAAFAVADEEFLDVILKNFTVLHYESIDYESRCRVLFMKCWDYLMAHPDELTFYVRYYYSASFQRYASREHMERYRGLLEQMETAFPKTTDVRTVMHHIFDTLLGEAMKQINDPQKDSSVAAALSFRLIFSVVRSYVRQDKLEEQR